MKYPEIFPGTRANLNRLSAFKKPSIPFDETLPEDLDPHYYDDEREEAEYLLCKEWLCDAANASEILGWLDDDEDAALGKLDAEIFTMLNKLYSGDNWKEIDTGIREASEKKRDLLAEVAFKNRKSLGIFIYE